MPRRLRSDELQKRGTAGVYSFSSYQLVSTICQYTFVGNKLLDKIKSTKMSLPLEAKISKHHPKSTTAAHKDNKNDKNSKHCTRKSHMHAAYVEWNQTKRGKNEHKNMLPSSQRRWIQQKSKNQQTKTEVDMHQCLRRRWKEEAAKRWPTLTLIWQLLLVARDAGARMVTHLLNVSLKAESERYVVRSSMWKGCGWTKTLRAGMPALFGIFESVSLMIIRLSRNSHANFQIF